MITERIAAATVSDTIPGLLSYKGLPEVDKAFSYALQEINDNRTVLPHTTLIPEILEMETPEDSPSVIIRNGRS